MSKSQIRTTEDIKSLGTILSVWAHPDDESFSCAGLMAAAVANGQEVVCVTATKGELGIQDESRWPAAKLAEIRAEEMRHALKVLGITDHHWLGYHDGQCNKVNKPEAVNKIKDLIRHYKPQTILTFGPDGMTGHPDHQTVSHWVDAAVQGTDITVYHSIEEEGHYHDYMIEADKKFDIYFNIDKPPTLPAAKCDIALKLDDEQIAIKCQSLRCMTSQTESMFKNTPPETMNAMMRQECFVLAK
jgi:LmbE family N-acetylglucosaminyl deacetylase